MSDLQPSAAYATIEEEYEARLRKAFCEHPRADYIVIHSRRQQFQMESIAWAMEPERNWLYEQECHGTDYDQDFELRYRLTEEGKEHFGLSGMV